MMNKNQLIFQFHTLFIHYFSIIHHFILVGVLQKNYWEQFRKKYFFINRRAGTLAESM